MSNCPFGKRGAREGVPGSPINSRGMWYSRADSDLPTLSNPVLAARRPCGTTNAMFDVLTKKAAKKALLVPDLSPRVGGSVRG